MTPINGVSIEPRLPIAIVRLDDLSEAINISRALCNGGIRSLEFPLTNSEALSAINQVRAEFGTEVRVGAGTVLTAQDAHAAIDAGAQFLVTPTYEPEVIDASREARIPIVCGAFTPTEILAAWRSGAELIKVFPARALGPSYIKDILAPLPELRLVPTGGVNLDNCAAFLDAGAYAVALGSNLVDPRMIAHGDWEAMAALAQRYVKECTQT